MIIHKFKTQKDAEGYAEHTGEGYVVYSLEHHCWVVKSA